MFSSLSSVQKAFVFTALGATVSAVFAAAIQLPNINIGPVFAGFTLLGGVAIAMGLWLWESIVSTSVTAPDECKSKTRDLAALRRIEAKQAALDQQEADAIAQTGAPTLLRSVRMAPITVSARRYSASGRLLPRGLDR